MAAVGPAATAVQLGHQVRLRYGLAELHRAGRGRRGRAHEDTASGWSAPRSPAPAAAAISATSSRTAPGRAGSATASTRCRWTWTRTAGRVRRARSPVGRGSRAASRPVPAARGGRAAATRALSSGRRSCPTGPCSGAAAWRSPASSMACRSAACAWSSSAAGSPFRASRQRARARPYSPRTWTPKRSRWWPATRARITSRSRPPWSTGRSPTSSSAARRSTSCWRPTCSTRPRASPHCCGSCPASPRRPGSPTRADRRPARSWSRLSATGRSRRASAASSSYTGWAGRLDHRRG